MTSQNGEAPNAFGDRELRILEFEGAWRRHDGRKEAAIRSEFGLSSARYYQLLHSIIDEPDAVRHDPILVRQLQQALSERTASRAGRRFPQSAPDPHRSEEPTE